MIWTVSKHNYFGLKIKIEDRDRYFSHDWKNVQLELPSGEIIQNINLNNKSFWSNTCHELFKSKLNKWLTDNGYTEYPKRHPPKFNVEYIGNQTFKILNQINS